MIIAGFVSIDNPNKRIVLRVSSWQYNLGRHATKKNTLKTSYMVCVILINTIYCMFGLLIKANQLAPSQINMIISPDYYTLVHMTNYT